MGTQLLDIKAQDSAAMGFLIQADESTPKNTARAKGFDIEQFNSWLNVRGLSVHDMMPKVAQGYLGHLGAMYSRRTIDRKLSHVRKYVDKQIGKDTNPFRSASFAEMLTKAYRLKASWQTKKAIKLSYAEIVAAVRTIRADNESPKANRNALILLLGFLGAFRRSELVSLKWEWLQQESGHIRIYLREGSKANQQNSKTEFKTFWAAKQPEFCPLALLDEWKQKNPTEYLFPRIRKGGNFVDAPISANTANQIIKENFGPKYSGHSLRRGFIYETHSLGAKVHQIAAQTGQTNRTIIDHYIGSEDKAKDNAVRHF